jgi:hypothetical protein
MACDEWEGDLGLYLDGELAEPGRRRVEEHLQACPACREELQALRRLNDLVRRAPPAASGGEEPFRGLEAALARGRARTVRVARLRVAAAAAACVLCLAAGYLLAPRGAAPPATLAERVTRLLAEYAETGSEARRRAIAQELEQEGEPALPYIVHALDSPALSLQVAATRVLGRSRDRKVAGMLSDYASSRGLLAPPAPTADDILAEPLSAESAVGLLDAEGVPRETLLAALRSTYNRFRLEPRTAETLRQVGFDRLPALAPEAQGIVDALRSRLRSGELPRQLAAIDIAGALRAEPLVPDLIACLGTEGAREAAWTVLRGITGQDLPLDAGAWEKWYRAAAKPNGSRKGLK